MPEMDHIEQKTDATRSASEDALLDRVVFSVEPEVYAEFLALLDAPPKPNTRLRRSLQAAAPWEKLDGHTEENQNVSD